MWIPRWNVESTWYVCRVFPPQQKVRRVGSYEIMLSSSFEKAWKSWNTNFSCCSVQDLSPQLYQALLLMEPPPNFIYLRIYHLQSIFLLKLSFSSFVKRIGKGCVWVWVLQGGKGGRERSWMFNNYCFATLLKSHFGMGVLRKFAAYFQNTFS